jgi:membrane protease YdiL (CAAX protease family)
MSISSQRRQVVVSTVLFEVGMGVLAWVLGWVFGQPPLQHFAWDASAAGWGVAASLPMLAVFAIFVRWPVGPLARIKEFADEVIRPWFAPCTVLDLALISLAAGIGEEMLFRGFAQGLFARWLGLWGGVIVASVLFGVVHLITLTYAILAGVIGIYLGAIQVHTDNLLAVILAHALYDFLALVYLVRGPGKPVPPLDNAAGD